MKFNYQSARIKRINKVFFFSISIQLCGGGLGGTPTYYLEQIMKDTRRVRVEVLDSFTQSMI